MPSPLPLRVPPPLRVPRLLLLVALFALPAFASAQVTEVLAVSPVAAPDGNGTIDNFIHQVGFPDNNGPTRSYGVILNDAGQVVFPAYLTGTAGGQDIDDSGLYLIDDDDEEVLQLYRAGDPAPDGDGVFYYVNNQLVPSLNNNGLTAVGQFATENDSGDLFEWTGLTVRPGETPQLFIREGEPVPGGEDIVQSIGAPGLTDLGQLTFSGRLEDTDPLGLSASFLGDAATGAIEILAREGEMLPDGNGRFANVSAPNINAAGEIVLGASIRGSDEPDDSGIYFIEADGETMRPIARVGDPVPGGNVLTVFLSRGGTINASGQVGYAAYSAPCTDCPITAQHIFRYDPATDTSTELLRTGTPSPDGGVWYSFKNQYRVTEPHPFNDAGQVAFHGETLRGGLIFSGFYRTDGTETIRIADNGEPTPSGNGLFLITSECCNGWDPDDVAHMNEQGQVAFFTNLRATDNGVLDNQGIFFYDDEMGLMEVARTFDEIDGSYITELRFVGTGGQGNARTGLNNLGQVAYTFQLNDGRTGVALWTAPSGLAVEATPLSPPVKIPPGGGSFAFDVTITNPTDAPITFEAWAEAEGTLRVNPVIRPRTLTLAPGASVSRRITQVVPGSAPAGVYAYNVNTGTFPELDRARGSFTVEKEAAAGRALASAERSDASTEAWTAAGWDELAEAAANASAPSEGTAEVAVTAASQTTPEVTRLDAPYPNPADGRAAIAYDLAQAADVRLSVFDVLGREVAVLTDERRPAGTHGVPFDTAQLPAGTYLVRLAAGEVQQTRRFTVVR